jgi:uncharacterized membrane protein
VLGASAFFKVRALEDEVSALRKGLGPVPVPAARWQRPGVAKQYVSEMTPKDDSAILAARNDEAPIVLDLTLDLPDDKAPISAPEPETPPNLESPIEQQPIPSQDFGERLQQQWMVWLGGGCVALAGIFLAKHSIEQGLLGPVARVVAGVFFTRYA